MKIQQLSKLMMWAAGLVTLSGMVSVPTAQAQAEGYPSRTITMLVPAAAGGTTDLAARMIAEPLSKALGQTVVVDNKPGASGNIATTAVARAKPDGYTLLMQYSGYHVITPAMTKMSWDPIKDFAPVANVLSAPQVVVVRPDLPIRTLPELVSYAKANPGKLNYASSGNGSLQHVTGEMLKQMAGIDMAHVPYKGTAPALTDLIGGSVDLTFTTAPPLLGHIKAGKLRALAVTGKSRLTSLPEVPAVTEIGFAKLDVSSWFAIYAPAATPKAIIDKLTAEISKAMQSEAFKRRAEEQGADAQYMNPQQLAEFTRAELARWERVVKTADIKPE